MTRAVIIDDEPLARERIRDLLADDESVEVAGEAGNGRDAVELIRTTHPDLLFLDVQMPEMDGFEVLRKLRGGRLPLTIFVTAFDEHAVRAFEFFAVDYLLKPFKRARFFEALALAKDILEHDYRDTAMTKALAMLEKMDAPREYLGRVPVKVGQNIHILKVETIDWIGAEDNYVRLHVGTKTYLLRETMNAIEARLDPDHFARIHRGTIVNIDRIRELRPWFNRDFQVVLADDTQLILSRNYRRQTRRLFGRE